MGSAAWPQPASLGKSNLERNRNRRVEATEHCRTALGALLDADRLGKTRGLPLAVLRHFVLFKSCSGPCGAGSLLGEGHISNQAARLSAPKRCLRSLV